MLGADAALLARLAVALATFFEDFGDHREGGAWLRAAEERADALEPGPRADLLFHLANYEIWHGGDRARLRDRYAECLAIRESLGDDVGAAFALTQLSAVAADLGGRDEALELGRRALAVVDEVDDPHRGGSPVRLVRSVDGRDRYRRIRGPGQRKGCVAAAPSGTDGRSRWRTSGSVGARS